MTCICSDWGFRKSVYKSQRLAYEIYLITETMLLRKYEILNNNKKKLIENRIGEQKTLQTNKHTKLDRLRNHTINFAPLPVKVPFLHPTLRHTRSNYCLSQLQWVFAIINGYYCCETWLDWKIQWTDFEKSFYMLRQDTIFYFSIQDKNKSLKLFTNLKMSYIP